MITCVICNKKDNCEYKNQFEEVKKQAQKLRDNLKWNSPIKVRDYCKDFEIADTNTVDKFIKEYEMEWVN